MATIKINVMTILAVLAIIFGAIALGLYEADRQGDEKAREDLEHELNMFEAGICVGILVSLIVLVITVCDKPASLTGKTFLMFAIAALILLAGIICMIVVEANGNDKSYEKSRDSDDPTGLRIASYVMSGAELLMLILGAIAPFIC